MSVSDSWGMNQERRWRETRPSAAVMRGDEQLFSVWKGGEKDSACQGLEKLLVLLVLSLYF